MLTGIGGAGESTVFGLGERLPLMHAAMLNAYQIHSQEFDCVHERAVVHPMGAVLPTLLGWAEREGGVSGALLIPAKHSILPNATIRRVNCG
jgi:aconitate decarboxylase